MDTLASEYGWSKKDILEDVYFDELYQLQQVIQERKIAEYKMQLAIVSNPHTKNPKELVEHLDRIGGVKLRDEKLDKEGFNKLREQLSTSKAIKVK